MHFLLSPTWPCMYFCIFLHFILLQCISGSFFRSIFRKLIRFKNRPKFLPFCSEMQFRLRIARFFHRFRRTESISQLFPDASEPYTSNSGPCACPAKTMVRDQLKPAEIIIDRHNKPAKWTNKRMTKKSEYSLRI